MGSEDGLEEVDGSVREKWDRLVDSSSRGRGCDVSVAGMSSIVCRIDGSSCPMNKSDGTQQV